MAQMLHQQYRILGRLNNNMNQIEYVNKQELNNEDDLYEITRNEILCRDIMKKLRPIVEEYASAVRQFIHTSMIRGFDRSMIEHSVIVFLTEINSLIAMVDEYYEYLKASRSPEARHIETEMKAVKASIGVIIKTVEKVILEEPVIDRQLFFN